MFKKKNPGLTETSGATTLSFPDEMCMFGTVGAISVYNELRLEEVPDMGYNPLASPPRGEIRTRGKTVFTGYHKSPDLTRDAIIDGWFHTGCTYIELFPGSKNDLFVYSNI